MVTAEQDRPDVARRRSQWIARQGLIDPARLVFIDETWTKTNMAPLRGWAPRGKRITAKVPYGHWQTMTFVATLRHDRVDAPWLLKGPINGDCFRTYVAEVLVPTLRPGDIVVLDNLGSHKNKAVRQAIRKVGAKLLFLPKCSPPPASPAGCACRSLKLAPPDLNPIEQLFAKIKHGLRAAAQRSFDTVSNAIRDLLATVSNAECANYLINAGYASK